MAENKKVKLPHNYKLIWDEAGIAVSAFAAFCKNESPSKNNVNEDYAPYAILRRQGEDIEVEIIGKMWRPHQDGITPQSLRNFKEYEIKQIAKDCLEGDIYGDYLYSEEEAAQLRARIIDSYVKLGVKACFEKYPQLNSATFLIAQYWNDEARDEVPDQKFV
ncbi:MAG: hypothetical protein EBE86_029985 [Hormoscilla sp. GUM202]|nr:hypothetical protein [Hormoscilla sp. GUM202]